MIAVTGFGTWPTPAEAAPKPKAGNPLAASWKTADPWSDGAWTTFAKSKVPALSAAQQAIRQAVVASAKMAGKAAMKVDVVAETSAGGDLTLLAGRELSWPVAKDGGPVGTVVWAEAVAAALAPAIGVGSAQDSLVLVGPPSKVAAVQDRWIARWGRLHQGVVVLGDELLVHADGQGRIRYLRARIAAPVATLDAVSPASQSLIDGSLLAWVPAGLDAGDWTLARGSAHGDGAWRSVDTGRELLGDRPTWVSFDAVVTTRAAGYTTDDHECRQNALTPVQCADPGLRAWILPENGAPHCCKAGSPPDCQPGAPGQCIDDFSPLVVLGRNNAVAMRLALTSFGINDYEPAVPGGFPAPLLVAPSSGTNSDETPPCKPPGPIPDPNIACVSYGMNECRGNVDTAFCAIAFRPTDVPGNSVACSPALAPVKGAILMSNAANAALDVMTHEFAHLWLAGHGFPVIDPNKGAGQPAVLHEAIGDGLALAVDTQNWFVGDGTQCASYRNACWPGCACMPSFTTDPGCDDPTNAPQCKPYQPRLWQDYALKIAKVEPVLATHHNTGIANFSWFLIGSDYVHNVGGGPFSVGQVIVGQGRQALGQLLGAWPAFWVQGALGNAPSIEPNFDGLNVTLTAAAQAMGPQIADTVTQAFAAVGLWRSDARSALSGVGRVAAFTHSDGAGGQLEYAVNWDGLRAFSASRCVAGSGACLMNSSVTIEDPSWPETYRPAGPPAVVDRVADSSVLYYPNILGQLWQQAVIQGGFEPPTDTGVLAQNTLKRRLPVGVAWDPAWGTDSGSTVLTYVCATPECTCGGLKQPGQNIICAQDFAGTWFKVVDELATLHRECIDVNQPLTPPLPLPAAVAPLHAPNAVLLGGSLVITWADKSENLADGQWRVHYRVAKRVDGAWQWGEVRPWLTKGDLSGEDLPAKTNLAHALGLLPGAGGWSAVDADNVDRVTIQYDPVLYPYASCAGQERFFAFASARLAENGLALADFSMGVAQNEGVAACLSAAAGGVNDFLREHGAAGAIHRSAGRSYAWIRRSPGGNELTKPEYGLESIPDYGPLLVKSTVWR